MLFNFKVVKDIEKYDKSSRIIGNEGLEWRQQ